MQNKHFTKSWSQLLLTVDNSEGTDFQVYIHAYLVDVANRTSKTWNEIGNNTYPEISSLVDKLCDSIISYEAIESKIKFHFLGTQLRRELAFLDSERHGRNSNHPPLSHTLIQMAQTLIDATELYIRVMPDGLAMHEVYENHSPYWDHRENIQAPFIEYETLRAEASLIEHSARPSLKKIQDSIKEVMGEEIFDAKNNLQEVNLQPAKFGLKDLLIFFPLPLKRHLGIEIKSKSQLKISLRPNAKTNMDIISPSIFTGFIAYLLGGSLSLFLGGVVVCLIALYVAFLLSVLEINIYPLGHL